MIERLRPTPEAAERIRQLGEKKIWQFLDEVTLGSAKNAAAFLPVVHGFRPQSEAGIKQQKLTLAKRLASKNAGTERDFIALYMMWRAWAWEQLGDPDAIDRLLDDLDNVLTQQKPQGDETGDVLRTGTLTFLTALKQLSLENKCSREKIARLIEFSPLTVDDAGQQIINSCKSESDIDRDKAITDLPNRLSADEKEIQTIKDHLAGLSNEIKLAAAKAETSERRWDAYEKGARILPEAVYRIDGALKALEGRFKDETECVRTLEKRFDEFARQLQSSDTRREELEVRSTLSAQSLIESISELRSIVEPLQYKLSSITPASTEAVESVAREVQAIGAKLIALSQGPAAEELDALTKRLDALESAKPVEAPTANAIEPAGVSVSVLTAASDAPVQPLSDAGKIVVALAGSLQSVGLKKSAAVLLAEEIAATILTGQVATFKGALAHLVAKRCAETLSSGSAWNISIPIGLTDGRSLSAALHSLSSKTASKVSSVVVEGLNRSALDCTKDALLAYAADHGANNKSPIFCFTSLVPGMASLPLEPEHLELGPVFDLDYLDWRLSADTNAAATINSVAPSAVASLRIKLTQGAADELDEVLRVLRKFMPKRNPRVERAVAAGYAALKNARQGRADASPMQSLAYGWLVPLWVALGLSKDDADSELDGGKCDASKPDPRVAAMLSQEPFAAARTESSQ